MKNKEEILLILKNIDFTYTDAIDYDYDRVEAPDHYERCVGDYCRCTTLENFVINKIDASLFIDIIKKNLNINNDLFRDELIKICKELETEDFYFDTSGGYYGEELDSITLCNSNVMNKLVNIFSIKGYRKEKLKQIISNSDNYILDDYVKKILTKEYGYVLDSLIGSKFKIIDINTKDIIFPQKEYNNFIKSQELTSYKNRKGICGLVKMIDGKYHIIDGYHRINANINKSVIKVILAYELHTN